VLDRRPEHLEKPACHELEEDAPERRIVPEAMGKVVCGLVRERVEGAVQELPDADGARQRGPIQPVRMAIGVAVPSPSEVGDLGLREVHTPTIHGTDDGRHGQPNTARSHAATMAQSAN
jgi:hypothetical protein